MKNSIIIIILLSAIFKFFGCKEQTKDESTNSIDMELKESLDNFMNRKIFKILTNEILDSVPNSDLEQTIIDNIYEQIGDDYSKEYKNVLKLSKGQQALYSTWWVEAEVNNGGFNQFYFNSSGQYSKIAVEGFELFDASKYADLMRRANKIYDENKERLEDFDDGTLESFSESYKENPLNGLDDEFHNLEKIESLSELRIKYIRKYPEEFIQK